MDCRKYITALLVCKVIMSCTNPVGYDIIETTAQAESIHTEGDMLKPIKDYPMYWESNSGTIWGVNADYPDSAPEKVDILDDKDQSIAVSEFHREGGTIYIKTSEMVEVKDEAGETIRYDEVFHYFKQASGKMEEITKTKYKPVPESMHFVHNFDGYKLTADNINGTQVSRVEMDFNPAGDEIFIMVDNAYRGEHGLFMSVIEGRGKARTPGLWFWPYGKTVLQQVKGTGRMW
jgi:hypothetical protein